jgi:hypothetical protein
MNILEKLWAKPVVKATVERMWRGGVVAVASAYAGGVIDLNGINPDTLTTALGIFVSGAVASLLLAAGVNAVTGTGPAINKAESFETPTSARRRNQGGYANLVYLLLAVLLFLIILFWFIIPAAHR